MKYSLLILTLVLTACSNPAPVYVAGNCPIPTIPAEPVYPFYSLSAADEHKPGKVVHACVSSFLMCQRDNGILRKKLEAFKRD